MSSTSNGGRSNTPPASSSQNSIKAGLPFGSLAIRLTAWYAGSAFLLILLATGFLYQVLAANLDREDDQYLAGKIEFLKKLLQDRPENLQAFREEMAWKPGTGQYGQFFMRI